MDKLENYLSGENLDTYKRKWETWDFQFNCINNFSIYNFYPIEQQWKIAYNCHKKYKTYFAIMT